VREDHGKGDSDFEKADRPQGGVGTSQRQIEALGGDPAKVCGQAGDRQHATAGDHKASVQAPAHLGGQLPETTKVLTEAALAGKSTTWWPQGNVIWPPDPGRNWVRSSRGRSALSARSVADAGAKRVGLETSFPLLQRTPAGLRGGNRTRRTGLPETSAVPGT